MCYVLGVVQYSKCVYFMCVNRFFEHWHGSYGLLEMHFIVRGKSESSGNNYDSQLVEVSNIKVKTNQ